MKKWFWIKNETKLLFKKTQSIYECFYIYLFKNYSIYIRIINRKTSKFIKTIEILITVSEKYYGPFRNNLKLLFPVICNCWLICLSLICNNFFSTNLNEMIYLFFWKLLIIISKICYCLAKKRWTIFFCMIIVKRAHARFN